MKQRKLLVVGSVAVLSVVSLCLQGGESPPHLSPRGEIADGGNDRQTGDPLLPEHSISEGFERRLIDPADSEERQLLTQRLNAAMELVGVTQQMFRVNVVTIEEVNDALREVFETELRMGESAEQRLKTAERLLEIAEENLKSVRIRVDMGGAIDVADLPKAKIAVIDAKLGIAQIKSETARTKAEACDGSQSTVEELGRLPCSRSIRQSCVCP